VTACVICSLVEDAYLYITVDGVEAQLHAEALLHVNSVFLSDSDNVDAGNQQTNFPLDNEGAQELLAIDIIENVSLLKTAKGEFQVILPWSSPAGVLQSYRSTSSVDGAEQTSIMNMVDEHVDVEVGAENNAAPLEDVEVVVESATKDQEDLNDYFTPVVISCGVKSTFCCAKELENTMDRFKIKKKNTAKDVKEVFVPEEVYLLVKIVLVGEERARVSVHSLRDSRNTFKGAPALPANTKLDLVIALPSVLSVESELMEEYFRNAASNIRVEHSQETGKNILIFQ